MVDLVQVVQAFAEDCIGSSDGGWVAWVGWREHECSQEGRWTFQEHLIPEDFDQLSTEAMDAFYEIVDQCPSCGWWMESYEVQHDSNGECVCSSCVEEDQ